MKSVFATKEDLQMLQQAVKEEVQGGFRPIKNGVQKLQKVISIVIKSFDSDITEIKRRVGPH